MLLLSLAWALPCVDYDVRELHLSGEWRFHFGAILCCGREKRERWYTDHDNNRIYTSNPPYIRSGMSCCWFELLNLRLVKGGEKRELTTQKNVLCVLFLCVSRERNDLDTVSPSLFQCFILPFSVSDERVLAGFNLTLKVTQWMLFPSLWFVCHCRLFSLIDTDRSWHSIVIVSLAAALDSVQHDVADDDSGQSLLCNEIQFHAALGTTIVSNISIFPLLLCPALVICMWFK